MEPYDARGMMAFWTDIDDVNLLELCAIMLLRRIAQRRGRGRQQLRPLHRLRAVLQRVPVRCDILRSECRHT
jgi:hypothetical protein